MHPFCTIGATVVGNPAATVIISSPGLNCLCLNLGEVRVETARRLALEPDAQSFENLNPTLLARSVSNFFANLPDVSHISNDASIRDAQSSSSKTLPVGGI